MVKNASVSISPIKSYVNRNRMGNPFPKAKPNENVQVIVCVPAYCELELEATLQSLAKNEVDFGKVEVWVHLNQAASDEEAQLFHQKQAKTLEEVSAQLPFVLRVLHHSFTPKKAGVGSARKTVMDAAVSYAKYNAIENGILLCLDADCTVSVNYLQEVLLHFQTNENTPACSIYFEHPLDGLPTEDKQAIVAYELHLRLYRLGLEKMGHPYAFYTVGSSMAARMVAYVKQGGMNTKKAGEDFYFLNKLMHLGNFTVCNSAKVYPSSRVSQRVPFGTGRAMEEVKAGKSISTYHPEIYKELQRLFAMLLSKNPDWENTTKPVRFIVESFDLKAIWEEVKKHTNDDFQFKKRLFQKIDLFACMKYIHALRDQFYPNVSVAFAFENLMNSKLGKNPEEMLLAIRNFDASK